MRVFKFDLLTILTIIVVVGVLATMHISNTNARVMPEKKAEQFKAAVYSGTPVGKGLSKATSFEKSVLAQLR